MEFGFSQEEINFREEVEDFLKSELPKDWPVKSSRVCCLLIWTRAFLWSV